MSLHAVPTIRALTESEAAADCDRIGADVHRADSIVLAQIKSAFVEGVPSRQGSETAHEVIVASIGVPAQHRKEEQKACGVPLLSMYQHFGTLQEEPLEHREASRSVPKPCSVATVPCDYQVHGPTSSSNTFIKPKVPSLVCPRNPSRIGGCGAYLCPVCGWKRALTQRAALAQVKHKALLTFTQVPAMLSGVLSTVKAVLRFYRRYDAIEMAWAIEENPNGTGHHIHALSRHDVDPALLSVAAEAANIGIAHVSPTPKHFTNPAQAERFARGGATYLLKFLEHEPGTPDLATALTEHLDLNGGRLIHNTRDYFDGSRGEALREASRVRLQAMRGAA